jgi:fatty acid desaturase
MLPDRKQRRPRLFGWWYLSIGAGFVLLGINRLLAGERAWPAALRLLIAAGFFALGYFELRHKGTGQR